MNSPFPSGYLTSHLRQADDVNTLMDWGSANGWFAEPQNCQIQARPFSQAAFVPNLSGTGIAEECDVDMVDVVDVNPP
jgi:hypothetical protein